VIGEVDLASRTVRRPDRIDLGGRPIPALLISGAVLGMAQALPPTVLRPVDATHVATALPAGKNLDHLITHDRRVINAAEAAGVRALAPA
jgi:hypothetical protein